jgi:hypothetical protein
LKRAGSLGPGRADKAGEIEVRHQCPRSFAVNNFAMKQNISLSLHAAEDFLISLTSTMESFQCSIVISRPFIIRKRSYILKGINEMDDRDYDKKFE